jgi:hypothetical protein
MLIALKNRRCVPLRSALACMASLSVMPLFAQTSPASDAAALDKPCILAGRLNNDQRWAPLARGLILLDGAGKRVDASSKEALAGVKAVRLSEPALLSQCNGNQALVDGASLSGGKSAVPAARAGAKALEVQAMYFPPARSGGAWVELQVALPADRLMPMTR